MKNIIKVLAVLGTFFFFTSQAQAQCKILSKDSYGSDSSRYIVGYYSNGKILSKDSYGSDSSRYILGYYSNGKILSKDSYGSDSSRYIVGYYSGGMTSCAAAAAFLLL